MREIFANHAHVFPESFRQDGSIPVLKEAMDYAGIASCVCFAPFYEYFHGALDSNEWLSQELKDETNLVGFGVIDFSSHNYADQVKKIADLGFKGIKVHPAFQKVRIDGPECSAVYAEAEKKNLIISFHTGIHWHRIADYNMLLFDEVAYRFPSLRITLEHVGGYCFFKDAVAVLLNNHRSGAPYHVYAGLTSVFDRDMNRYWYLSDEQIKDLLWLVGEEACIFGIDFPFNSAIEIKRVIDHIESMDIPEMSKDAILGGNLSRLLATR